MFILIRYAISSSRKLLILSTSRSRASLCSRHTLSESPAHPRPEYASYHKKTARKSVLAVVRDPFLRSRVIKRMSWGWGRGDRRPRCRARGDIQRLKRVEECTRRHQEQSITPIMSHLRHLMVSKRGYEEEVVKTRL